MRGPTPVESAIIDERIIYLKNETECQTNCVAPERGRVLPEKVVENSEWRIRHHIVH